MTLLHPPISQQFQRKPLCANKFSIVQFYGLKIRDDEVSGSSNNVSNSCLPQSRPMYLNLEFVPESHVPCFFAVTLGVELRLRSPSISSFLPHINNYRVYIISSIGLALYINWQSDHLCGRKILG